MDTNGDGKRLEGLKEKAEDELWDALRETGSIQTFPRVSPHLRDLMEERETPAYDDLPESAQKELAEKVGGQLIWEGGRRE